MRNAPILGMPNTNGRNRDTYQPRPSDEHGYQDVRDQRDRENGRDDFRGLDSDNDQRFGDRASGGGGGDQFAERDRNMYGDRGYGYNDGSMGQSGSHAGGPIVRGWRGQGVHGGSEGHWGDMDRGGRSSMRGPHAGKGPQGFQRSDERIKEMVHEALTDHEHIDATHIVVDVTDGEVTLTGRVDDRQTKRLADDIVDRVTGVKDVHNQLRIGDDKPRTS
jgi:osmotically-inducible protein OsmY